MARTRSVHGSIPTSTPWGRPQQQFTIAPGMTQFWTAGHGGIWLSGKRMQALPEAARAVGLGLGYGPVDERGRPSGWFEEDCDWALVAMCDPDYASERHLRRLMRERRIDVDSARAVMNKHIADARESVKSWHPHAYMAITGETLDVSDSHILRQEQFVREHANDWVAVSAVTSNIDPNQVIVSACIGGRGPDGHFLGEVHDFLVEAREYQAHREAHGRLPFVIDLQRHLRIGRSDSNPTDTPGLN